MGKTYKNGGPPEGAVYFNYRTAKKELPDAQSLPTLIRAEAMEAILKNEENPLYRAEAIDYPVKGTGGVYTERFFESFLERMKAHPFGGNKLGHSFPEKNDFYTVGGKLEKKGGGSGTVYFKIVIPQTGYETTNSGFIRDLQAGNVHFSLVTVPEFEMVQNEKTKELERHFIKSLGNERNDAVPFGCGAMPQAVGNSFDYEQARNLIANGQVDYKSKGNEVIQNGQVTYSALRRLAAGADSRTPALSELVSLADKQRNNRRRTMEEDKAITKEEALKTLAGLYRNGLIKMGEIAAGIGSTAPQFLRSEEDDANAALANGVRGRLGDKPLEELDKVLSTKAENERFLAQNAVRAQVGPEKVRNARGEETANPAYEYAMKACGGKTGRDLQNALDALKGDSVMQALLAAQADCQSEFNRVESGGGAKNGATEPAVMEV